MSWLSIRALMMASSVASTVAVNSGSIRSLGMVSIVLVGGEESAAWGLAEKKAMNRSPEPRSEEHTSELQSRVDLVCRLLLEKKKHKTTRAERCREVRE